MQKNRHGERSVAIQSSNKIYVITGSPRSLYSLVKSLILSNFGYLHAYASGFGIIFTCFVACNASATEFSGSLLGGVTHTRKGNHQTALFGGEIAINDMHELIKPKIGYIQSAKQSKYIYSGFDVNFKVPSTPIIIQPGFSIGAYDKGHCKNLGGALEFQSAIGVMYEVNKKFSVGAVLSHISNAGLYKRNPGTEHVVAKLTYVF